ncbi:endomucin isoform X3 [Antechinus flavipes]|uniref:endomucin isoform X3 n=1 Tax=Antechinus flavipes TaxID=38775 RepID=UPI002236A2AB|nr:endomucin isoform X3 [Antechinus flavipes]
MKLLQGTFLFLSICNLCHTQENQGPTSIATVTTLSSPTILTSPSPSIGNNETIQTSVNTQEKQDTTVTTLTTSVGSSLSSLINPTLTGTVKESLSTTVISIKSSSSSAVVKTAKETTQNESSSVFSTANPQDFDQQFKSTVLTTQSSQKSNHILTSSTKKPENTLGMITTPYIKDQGSTKDSSNTSSFVTNSSYSSVILPVVIALIAITLSVFTLVGLYRMCWKTDPGTPDNGTDQPQSDKESVKLLTVKTISPEISEQSAQGKNKN